MTDEDLAVYREIVEAARKAAQIEALNPEATEDYEGIRAAFERGDWQLFKRIEKASGFAMRDELRRQVEERALRTEAERLRAENAALREIVGAVANARGGGTSGLYLTVPETDPLDDEYAWHLVQKARALLSKEALHAQS